jgi:signal transduction histidine kinase
MMMMMMTTTPTAPTATTERTGRWRRAAASITTRLLVGYVLILALATLASILVVREVLLSRLDERIDADLVQEARELTRLSRGNDPDTGAPFHGDVERIFDVFLTRNIPSQHETMVTFIDGKPFLRSQREPAYRVDEDPRLVSRWAGLSTTDRGRVETPSGSLDYLAVPLLEDGKTAGVFVVGAFRDLAAADVHEAVRVAAWVGLAMLLIGSVLATVVARRIIRPVEVVTTTAHSITETDLTKRIAVTGHDEVSRLAHTFNQMLDRLEAAFETQRRFVDDAGHELRTPITVVRGHLEVMGEDPNEQRETIALVLDELDRMNRIVDDLLVLAKSEQPDFLRLETVDLETLLHTVYSKAQALAARDWRLEHVGTGLVVGDRQRMTQALMQLAQNAAQHTESNDVIAMGSVVEDGIARLWVRDTGRGIAPEDQTRIFGRFARGKNGRRRSEGAGLGLSIVKAIVEAHDGRVELHSRPGEGSIFTLVMPVELQAERVSGHV